MNAHGLTLLTFPTLHGMGGPYAEEIVDGASYTRGCVGYREDKPVFYYASYVGAWVAWRCGDDWIN